MTVVLEMAVTVDDEDVIVGLVLILTEVRIFLFLFMVLCNEPIRRRSRLSTYERTTYSLIERAPDQHKPMLELVGVSNVTSLDSIKMNTDKFK